jgi:hypothetical protein
MRYSMGETFRFEIKAMTSHILEYLGLALLFTGVIGCSLILYRG